MKNLYFLAFAVVLAGCTAPNAVGLADQLDPPVEQAAPSLALSANLLTESVGVAGSPVLIELVVSSPDGRDALQPVTLSSAGGSWESLFQIEVRDSAGNLVPGLYARPLLEPEESTTVTLESSALAVWAIETDAAMPAGSYTIEAVLDTTTSAGEGWKGKCSSGRSTLVLKSGVGQLTPEEATIFTLASARVHEYALELDEALALVVSALEKTPQDSLLLEEKADILAKSGSYDEAIAAYDAALALVRPQEDVLLREPPESLLQKKAIAEERSKALSRLKQ